MVAGKTLTTSLVTVAVVALFAIIPGSVALADTFGTGSNQMTLDFVPISSTTNPTSGHGIVSYDYRMGTYEITNDQWNKFKANLGKPVTGADGGYDYSSHFTGLSQPTDSVSWYEAAQFVNWLNTSTGHHPAYKFTGMQGTYGYYFVPWSPGDAGYDANNPFRNTTAHYFLPTENEWVKAAYWNGATLQQYATKAGESLTQGNGTSGTGWNYWGPDGLPSGTWNVSSGSQELNGTYDMMGNVGEWMESPYTNGSYTSSSTRGFWGGFWSDICLPMNTSISLPDDATSEAHMIGFRVASVPEPGSVALLLCGAIAALIWWRGSEKGLIRG